MRKPTFHHRHHIRSTFYNAGIILFVSGSMLNYTGDVNDFVYKWFCIALIVIDYIAEMYDPHPDSPGPWFKKHFHRMLDNEDD